MKFYVVCWNKEKVLEVEPRHKTKRGAVQEAKDIMATTHSIFEVTYSLKKIHPAPRKKVKV